ncbi:hypothetical protein JXB12_01490 [candidate division KSB1 bacterium]|nr:hypothetical protein [candidate division KSB1 bacterium]
MIIERAAYISMVIMTISLFIAFLRLVKGPSTPDRIVALDLITMLTLGMILAYCMLTGQFVYLNTTIILALITFLGTVAYARYLEKRVL